MMFAEASDECATGSKYDILADFELPQALPEKWQAILNTVAEIIHVPVALVMRVRAHEIEVYARNDHPDSPYEEGERAKLDTGLYCETVMTSRKELLVPTALLNREWADNPDVPLGMISYLGVPLEWPTGHVFGTVCVLDSKSNAYSTLYRRLLGQFRDMFESELALLYSERQLSASYNKLKDVEELRDHLVGMIVHDMRNPIMGVSNSLELIADQMGTPSPNTDCLDMARSCCGELRTMVESLLDVARLEAGEMPVAAAPCDLRARLVP